MAQYFGRVSNELTAKQLRKYKKMSRTSFKHKCKAGKTRQRQNREINEICLTLFHPAGGHHSSSAIMIEICNRKCYTVDSKTVFPSSRYDYRRLSDPEQKNIRNNIKTLISENLLTRTSLQKIVMLNYVKYTTNNLSFVSCFLISPWTTDININDWPQNPIIPLSPKCPLLSVSLPAASKKLHGTNLIQQL